MAAVLLKSVTVTKIGEVVQDKQELSRAVKICMDGKNYSVMLESQQGKDADLMYRFDGERKVIALETNIRIIGLPSQYGIVYLK